MGEELNRSLRALAERGDARGAQAVLEDARAEAAGEHPVPPTWRRGVAVALGTAAVALLVVGAALVVLRGFTTEETPTATTGPSMVTTTIPIHRGNEASTLNDVNDLAVGPDGNLWAATAAGVVRWDTSDGSYVTFTEDDGLPARSVGRITVGLDGAPWVLGDDWLATYDGRWEVYSGHDDPALSGDLGPMTVGDSGVVWVVVGAEQLVRFDGEWTSVGFAPVGIGPFSAGLDDIAVAPDGSVWLESELSGVARFDGTDWRAFGEADGAPSGASNLAIGTDGTIWIGDPQWFDDAESGIARYDGTAWQRITTADGLLANEGDVFAGPDGSVWVVHAGAGVSHFDGTTWTTYAEPLDGDLSAAVDADGDLWVAAVEGVRQFRISGPGTLLAIPDREAAPPFGSMTASPADVVQRIKTPLGSLEFVDLHTPPGHNLWDTEVTPFGYILRDDDVLRQSGDGATWDVVISGVEDRWMTTDGADLIVYDEGFVRYSWTGSEWSEVHTVDLPGTLDGLAFGPAGAIALIDGTVYYSLDGVAFSPAENGPGSVVEGTSRGCDDSWPEISLAGPDSGPILVTDDGFALLASAVGLGDPWPLCEPLVWVSPDGSSWDLATESSPFGESISITDVESRDGRHVAMGTEALWVSDDGVVWESVEVPQLEQATSVVAGELGWVLLGSAEGASDLDISIDMWFSADGTTWDGPHAGPEGLAWAYFRIEPAVGADAILSVSGTHDGLVIGRLEE